MCPGMALLLWKRGEDGFWWTPSRLCLRAQVQEAGTAEGLCGVGEGVGQEPGLTLVPRETYIMTLAKGLNPVPFRCLSRKGRPGMGERQGSFQRCEALPDPLSQGISSPPEESPPCASHL